MINNVESEESKKNDEVKKEEKPAKVEETPKEEVRENSSDAKTHVVAPGETLFRIAMNYYGTPDGVGKIKAANGLSSNDISAGQSLIIP